MDVGMVCEYEWEYGEYVYVVCEYVDMNASIICM